MLKRLALAAVFLPSLALAQTGTFTGPLVLPPVAAHAPMISFTEPEAGERFPLFCTDPKKAVTIRAISGPDGKSTLSVSCEAAP